MRLVPVSQKDLIKRLHSLGWEGPEYRSDHPFMLKRGSPPLKIPNPHSRDILHRSPDKNSEAGQNFPKRMARDWLGGCELRRLNAFQSWQRLAPLQLELDPPFQHLA